MFNKITIGCDPELFVANAEGVVVSAHNLLPGTKQVPHKTKYGAVQVDGTAAEFNINPAATVDEFVSYIRSTMRALKGMLPKGYTLKIAPSHVYEESYFNSLPEYAKELGCDPDYDAYTDMPNPRPDQHTSLRTASGHVHIGWTNLDKITNAHRKLCATVVRELDYTLGLASMKWDPDGTRRTLYGKAGAFRIKPYGVEYRVLSNKWLKSTALMRTVYELVSITIKNLANNQSVAKEYPDLAQYIINNNITDWEQQFPFLKEKLETLGVYDAIS